MPPEDSFDIYKSDPECLQKCLAAQRVPNPRRSVKKGHEFLPDCDNFSRPSQNFQVTKWIASIYGKEKNDSFNRRMEETQTSTIHTSAKISSNGQQQKLNSEKAAISSEKGKGKAPATKTYIQGCRILNIQQDAMENVFQMARTMIELQKKEETRLKYQNSFLRFWMVLQTCI
ncbi:hypothetical protein O181_085656 [Austropuccinia psidii MF-1]|uniref:Uncharacterized protein n=1 Tax=Austropuccinia psidii MF-1 TaxID=1389203 RepID=A0A9Q3FTC4_9BASI|nr:hypothetical protein [Austropuccinia psidii MF-1]